MNTTLLLWLTLFVISGLAIVLYTPRKFSGPLTAHERRTAGRRLRRLSLLMTLATPLATVAGLALLVPPPVALEVRSPSAPRHTGAGADADRPFLASLSFHVSTREWTESVLCHALELAPGDEARALPAAIVAAARDGFHVPARCTPDRLTAVFDDRDYRNVELTLVELAARAFHLTDVELHTGPRLRDPDPWDIMESALNQRGVVPRRFNAGSSTDPNQILRLSRARIVDAAAGSLDTLALVRGSPCGEFRGRLFTDGDRTIGACSLSPRQGCEYVEALDQRVLWMRARCDPFAADVDQGLLLSVDFGEVQVVPDTPISVSGNNLDRALELARATDAFAGEIRMHGLRTIVADGQPGIRVDLGDRIVLRGGQPIPGLCTPSLGQGPFSWSGMKQPGIDVAGDTITIAVNSGTLDPRAPGYDPTAFYATLYTITWAANSLQAGSCLKLAEPRLPAAPLPAHPLLTAQQLDTAVAGLRRGQETMGLVLLALSLLSLALGLRRSVL
jgi:hypothetical protein